MFYHKINLSSTYYENSKHRLYLQSQGISDIDQVQQKEFSTWFENKVSSKYHYVVF